MAELAIRGGNKTRTKPFPKWPVFDDTDLKALREVLESGVWGIDGPSVPRFEGEFARMQQARHAISVSSGTTGLEVALKACGVRAGDEVIVPAYTFVATATAVASVGAVPVFADIECDTCTIDPRGLDSLITPRTRAIVPVHIGGRPADLDAVMAAARPRGIRVIEDACQAPLASWRGVMVGAIGDIGVFSFQSSKNLNCGEGGVVVTNDDALAEAAWSLHNCGRARGGAWYEHPRIGGNARMTEFQAALLLSQMARLPGQTERRRRAAERLAALLARAGGIRPMRADPRVTGNAWHLYVMRYDKHAFGGAPKAAFLAALAAEGIPCGAGYVPLYRQAAFREAAATFPVPPSLLGRSLDYAAVSCPASEAAAADEAVWLWQSMLLGDEADLEDIAAAVEKIRRHAGELQGA
jgi:dTDP-4-amino-4,6-dideoxygalactose transaminase